MSDADVRKKNKEALLVKMHADRAALATQVRLVEVRSPRSDHSLIPPQALAIVSRYGYVISGGVAVLGVLGPKLLKGVFLFAFRRLMPIVTGRILQKIAGRRAAPTPAKRRIR